MSIAIVTNAVDENELAQIRALGAATLEGGKELRILSFPGLEQPFDLTWSHKPALQEAFSVANPAYSHFIYLEDDLRLTFTNFRYYVCYSDKLACHSLIPAFLRVEYNHTKNDIFSSDIPSGIRIDDRPSVELDSFRFINSDFPYMGMFVMNRAQMLEYTMTRSFDRERSAEVHSWWIAERSAMGLTWEAVPDGYTSRYVIPIDLASRRPSPSCYVHHLPGNYTNRDEIADPPYGELRMADAFY
ncbi:MAG TPA: hypothetical protein VF286_00250 [Acidiphilium sp.]